MERAAVEAFFETVAKVWSTNDGAALADLFVEDGSLINPFGERADGRGAIAAMYRSYFGTVLRGTDTAIEIGAIRPVGANHAFVDAEQSISAGGQVVMAVHLAALLQDDGGTVRFVDSRPFTVAAPPA